MYSRSFTLTPNPSRLADFYQQLRQRARDPAQALQQLTTAQTLIGLGNDHRDHPTYRQARQNLEEQLEQVPYRNRIAWPSLSVSAHSRVVLMSVRL